MQRYKYAFFDLDGTLYDSGNGIRNAARYALGRFDIHEINDSMLNRFIGPPLKRSFMDFYGLSENDAVNAIGYFREYYSDKGIFEGEIYKGVDGMLKELYDNNVSIVLATSKPEVYACRILDNFRIHKYFDFVSAASFDESLVEKTDIIKNAAVNLDIDDMMSVLMIGDRLYDIAGGKNTGTATAGVLYGYGTYTELYGAGSDYIVSSAEELKKILLYSS